MKLEISDVYASDFSEQPENVDTFFVPIIAEINEKGKPGAEIFHFVAASPTGLSTAIPAGESRFVRGLILIHEFDWALIQHTIQNIVNHAQSSQNWAEAIEFLNRYSRYDSEDLS